MMRWKRSGGREGGRAVFTQKVRGRVIKSVRLLATLSNLKELISATSQACGSANQLSGPVSVRRTAGTRWNKQKKVAGGGGER